VERGVKSITLNGKPLSGEIPAQPRGTVNEVVVVMG
jgi:N,N'-diacetylchitobiose phosphorylase